MLLRPLKWKRSLIWLGLSLLSAFRGVNTEDVADEDYQDYQPWRGVYFLYERGASCTGYNIKVEQFLTSCDDALCNFGDDIAFTGICK
jgi:hypothetical protein